MVVGLHPYLFEIFFQAYWKERGENKSSINRQWSTYDVFVRRACALKDNKQDVTYMFSIKSSIATRQIHHEVPTAECDFKSPSTEVTEESWTVQPARICWKQKGHASCQVRLRRFTV